jgi:hypothetical protein
MHRWYTKIKYFEYDKGKYKSKWSSSSKKEINSNKNDWKSAIKTIQKENHISTYRHNVLWNEEFL